MDSATYKARRKVLRQTVTDGVILIFGNNDSSRNYRDNIYPFRQDSNFIYLTGINKPGMALMLFPDGKEEAAHNLMAAVDAIRKRFGVSTVQMGRTLILSPS